MLNPYSAVIVYYDGTDSDGKEAGYCLIAHNLAEWDARRLAERLEKQYELDAFTVYHINHHDDKDAASCPACRFLVESVAERSFKKTAKEWDNP